MGTPRHAIILTAAPDDEQGRALLPDVPAGLIELGGESILARLIRQLSDAGVDQLTVVAAEHADSYRRFAATRGGIDVVVNDKPRTTGSMASLAIALARVQHDVLIVSGSLVCEPRALEAVLAHASPDVTLLSGPTGSGEERWAYASGGRLCAISRCADELPAVTGEFVGITRLSASAATAMCHAFSGFVEAYDHGRMDYETDALAAIAELFPIAAVLVRDLCWADVTSDRQLERVIRQIWPALAARVQML